MKIYTLRKKPRHPYSGAVCVPKTCGFQASRHGRATPCDGTANNRPQHTILGLERLCNTLVADSMPVA